MMRFEPKPLSAVPRELGILRHMEGNFEEAFGLCACNHAPTGQVGQGERACGKPEMVLTDRLRLAAHAVTLEICVGPNTATLR